MVGILFDFLFDTTSIVTMTVIVVLILCIVLVQKVRDHITFAFYFNLSTTSEKENVFFIVKIWPHKIGDCFEHYLNSK